MEDGKRKGNPIALPSNLHAIAVDAPHIRVCEIYGTVSIMKFRTFASPGSSMRIYRLTRVGFGLA
ncbi:hypothetical protein T4C_10167 [Trichinella pseudospiralis]|uniref:Uncharacterized protein n=1 Tax=Trichinella pseudospiralis TaxID=6337 RepID=A0A0V1IN08_TRIPS|nr:hypothetical protein T4C_8474 [Trichinella pseudospiralis]KRZ24254.1 hypothetical protein T4C_10167 [Trichinella pseudospiralis]